MLTLLDFPFRAHWKKPDFQSFGLILALCVAASGIGCSSLTAGGASTPQKVATPIAISAQMPTGTIGTPYNMVLAVNGGVAPYTFSVRTGRLPFGLHLDSSSGTIAGNPTATGWFPFVVSVSDSSGQAHGVHRFSISVHQPPVQVIVSPESVVLAPGATHQFAVQVAHTSNHAVAWSSSAGTVSSNGLFTAPKTTASTQITVVATSKQDPTKRASASITVNTPVVTPAALSITSSNLPEGAEASPYAATLRATGGTAPYHWHLSSGKLPAGFVLDAATGSVDGTTSQSGAFPMTVAVSDASGHSVTRALSLNVTAAASASSTDGPAELPRVHVNSAMSDTPAPGKIRPVKTSAELQAALKSAECGDIISLQSGTTFTGTFTFPAKPCDDSRWIVVRSSAADSALPPEGTRATPCYAGTASLPGRPSLGCAATSNVMAKLAFSGTGSGPVVFADGANHYRLLGLEITRSTPKAVVYNLVSNTSKGSWDHIVIDRSWLHGTAQDETTRGAMLSGGTYVAIVDSFFSDFHCVAISGSCGDSQAITGGLGSNVMGPYKIVGNFLEAAGENVLFGGGAADRTPEDVEIRGNHFFKPMTWLKGQPGFVGGRDGHPFVVKNHFELKNGAHVLFENNILENTWGGFSQAGFSVLLTPKNQNGLCPLCVVHDITIRYNLITHAGSGFQIGNGASDSGALSQGMWNVSIHDVLMNDLNGAAYQGSGFLFQQSNGNPVSVLHDVSITHVTGFSKSTAQSMIVIGNSKSSPMMYGFTWANNIFTAGLGITTTGGGAENCAFQLSNAGLLANCFKQWTFSHNVLLGAKGNWPAENFPATLAQLKLNSVGNLLSQFTLLGSSPFVGVGSDGKNPGVDMDGLAAALAGVQ